MADLYPIFHPADARRLYTSESNARRYAKVAHWSAGSRLLELCGSVGSLYLAKEAGLPLTVADVDGKALDVHKERAKVLGIEAKVRYEQAAFNALPFKEGEFDGVLVLGRLLMPLEAAATSLRRLLAPKGRLVLTWPVKVGRVGLQDAIKFWETRLGQPLLMPRETLMAVERQGFEPETIETPAPEELDEYYKDLETALGRQDPNDPHVKAAQQEIAFHRDHGQRQGVAIAVIVARRKEPGERPPASRDNG
jgi:ubiquinone/menaquinone biosynthesis C-methylase UbiE